MKDRLQATSSHCVQICSVPIGVRFPFAFTPGLPPVAVSPARFVGSTLLRRVTPGRRTATGSAPWLATAARPVRASAGSVDGRLAGGERRFDGNGHVGGRQLASGKSTAEPGYRSRVLREEQRSCVAAFLGAANVIELAQPFDPAQGVVFDADGNVAHGWNVECRIWNVGCSVESHYSCEIASLFLTTIVSLASIWSIRLRTSSLDTTFVLQSARRRPGRSQYSIRSRLHQFLI
jgi:hypothetical protein